MVCKDHSLESWSAWLLMWRRRCLASCPNGEGGSISKSYCDTGCSRPLMCSQQQAAGAEEWRPESFQRQETWCVQMESLSTHSVARWKWEEFVLVGKNNILSEYQLVKKVCVTCSQNQMRRKTTDKFQDTVKVNNKSHKHKAKMLPFNCFIWSERSLKKRKKRNIIWDEMRWEEEEQTGKRWRTGESQTADQFPSSLSVYWTVIMNNTPHM